MPASDAATAGRGQAVWTAATIAAASSSVGAGLTKILLLSNMLPSLIEECLPADYSGTLPCLRLGNSSRLVRNMSRPAMTLRLVSAGSMTSST